jgi:hypothetical protein
MVYNTQDYWVSGVCPSYSILEHTKQVSSFQGTQLSRCLPPHLRTETSSFRNVVLTNLAVSDIHEDIIIKNLKNGKSPALGNINLELIIYGGRKVLTLLTKLLN